MPGVLSTYSSEIARVLSDTNSFATTMIVALVDEYGTELFSWAPTTILMETEYDFGFKWKQTNFDRLMAGIVLITTDRFYKSLPDFVELCDVLSGGATTPGVFSPADAAECAWGITEALLLAPPDEEDEEPFTTDIRAYLGEIIKMEGILTPPDILRIALHDGEAASKVRYAFSDDPEMFNAVFDMQSSKTEEINTLIKERLALLVQQLSSLKLANGNTANLAKRMLAGLSTLPSGGTPLL